MEKKIVVVGSLNPEKDCQDRVRVLGGGVSVKAYGQQITKTRRKLFGVLKALNDQDGLYRTLKSQYQKNSIANFMDSESRGATGVIRCRKRQ